MALICGDLASFKVCPLGRVYYREGGGGYYPLGLLRFIIGRGLISGGGGYIYIYIYNIYLSLYTYIYI